MVEGLERGCGEAGRKEGLERRAKSRYNKTILAGVENERTSWMGNEGVGG